MSFNFTYTLVALFNLIKIFKQKYCSAIYKQIGELVCLCIISVSAYVVKKF